MAAVGVFEALPMDYDQVREVFLDENEIRALEARALLLEGMQYGEGVMLDIPVTGTDLEELGYETYPIPRLKVNQCGQWEVTNQPGMIAGTTGYYKPFTFIEAALYQVFKDNVYKANKAAKVPYSMCHTPGPKCVTTTPTWKRSVGCGAKKRRVRRYRTLRRRYNSKRKY